ncbi:hypothetical protein [Leptolyngbya sp. 7M]|nr:hypothetical protein [Leptolyngbya sp. 7M]
MNGDLLVLPIDPGEVLENLAEVMATAESRAEKARDSLEKSV